MFQLSITSIDISLSVHVTLPINILVKILSDNYLIILFSSKTTSRADIL